MGKCQSLFVGYDCGVANSVELVHSAKDSHTFIKTKDFTFLLLTLSRHFLVQDHWVLQSPWCFLNFARLCLLALLTPSVTAVLICAILLHVSD